MTKERKQQGFYGDLNEIFDSNTKQGLLHVAIVELIEKANTENWATGGKLYDAAKNLVEINKDLTKKLEEIQ